MRELYSFKSFELKNLKLKNRLVMPPMCMYSAKDDGMITDFHITHYTSRAVGAIGLIIVEATGVMPNGRISDRDLGLWENDQIAGMKELVRQVKYHGTKIGIQLNHGGRKYEGKLPPVGPSPIAYDEKYRVPEELTIAQIQEIATAFGHAARRADLAGFDLVEIHGAHGYLINQFLSPHSNKRTDEYGGNREKRVRFLQDVIAAVKANWPADKTLALRISGTEYMDDGYDVAEMVEMLKLVKDDLDLIHVSSGGNGPWKYDVYPGYQVAPAQIIKEAVGLPVIAVGLLDDIKLIEEVLGNQRADLVAIGRGLLVNPYFALQEAVKHDVEMPLPYQYARAYRK